MSTTGYTTRQALPYLIELGRDTLLTVPVYLDGALVEPDDGTAVVYDDNNESVYSSAVTVTGSIARITVPSASTSGRGPSAGWRVEWTLTIDGETDDVTFREEAALVRQLLRPVIADLDIGRRVPTLAITFGGRPTTDTTYHDYIVEADVVVQSRLLELGRRPWLVVSPSALRETWLTLTISLIYGALAAAAGDGAVYVEKAEEWERKYEAAFSRARTAFDWDDDGQADEGVRVGPRPGGVWLC